MTETNDLIAITQSGRIGDFNVEPDNVMVLPGGEYTKGEISPPLPALRATSPKSCGFRGGLYNFDKGNPAG